MSGISNAAHTDANARTSQWGVTKLILSATASPSNNDNNKSYYRLPAVVNTLHNTQLMPLQQHRGWQQGRVTRSHNR